MSFPTCISTCSKIYRILQNFRSNCHTWLIGLFSSSYIFQYTHILHLDFTFGVMSSCCKIQCSKFSKRIQLIGLSSISRLYVRKWAKLTLVDINKKAQHFSVSITTIAIKRKIMKNFILMNISNYLWWLKEFDLFMGSFVWCLRVIYIDRKNTELLYHKV